jgi:class 3 adenylate cyclase
VTILFTDIEGFTDLTERVGDEAAHEIVKRHAALVREQVAACGGLEVNTAGDGFMIAFSSARQAVRCAVAIQRGLAGWTATDGKPVRVRIGLHTGDAINDADDFFGLTVNVAARIAASAGGGEILVSHITRTLAGNMGDVEFGEERALQLRGVSGEHRAHLVDWAGADATQ